MLLHLVRDLLLLLQYMGGLFKRTLLDLSSKLLILLLCELSLSFHVLHIALAGSVYRAVKQVNLKIILLLRLVNLSLQLDILLN